MALPKVILAPNWRRMSELFAPDVLADLETTCDIIWGQDEPIPLEHYDAALAEADVLITAKPVVTVDTLAQAPRLRMVIEVSGSFPDTIDYTACAERGVEVLCCAPGFRQSVAEMGFAMALGGARGLVAEHEAMRTGKERWLDDRPERDFTLFGAKVGFIGFGQIAQEIARLMQPFSPQLTAYDPWLPDHVARDFGAELGSLDAVLRSAQCLFVTAVPTAENKHLLNEARLRSLPKGALIVLLSRAHLVDFSALRDVIKDGHIRAAIDVFPTEPLPANDVLRQLDGVVLSPHRAAAVEGGRHLIGEMIRDDINALMAGSPTRRLSAASRSNTDLLAGVGDARSTEDMALLRG